MFYHGFHPGLCLLFFQRTGFDLPCSAALWECGLSTFLCWVSSHNRQMLEEQTASASLHGDKQDRGHLPWSHLQWTEHLGNKHSVARLCSQPRALSLRQRLPKLPRLTLNSLYPRQSLNSLPACFRLPVSQDDRCVPTGLVKIKDREFITILFIFVILVWREEIEKDSALISEV